MLIDGLLPRYDANEVHSVRVRASQQATYDAIATTDLAESVVVRALLALRALPAAVAAGPSRWFSRLGEARAPVTLRTFEQRGFRLLADDPPNELVLGLEGRFWTMTGELCTPPAEAFSSAAPRPGTARAAWNFSLAPHSPGCITLTTETRILCADDDARQRFLRYWSVISPGSAVIRHVMLRAIRNTAERAASES